MAAPDNPSTPTPQPVRVRVYGLVPLTRSQYVGQLALALVLLFCLGLVWWNLPPIREEFDASAPPMLRWIRFLLANLHLIIFVLAVLLALEAWIVFRRFAAAEKARRTPTGDTHDGTQPLAPVPEAGGGEPSPRP